MTKYTRFEVPGRGWRYQADGSLISVKKVPPEEIARLEAESPTPVAPEVETGPKTCIFCGVETKISRLINQQSIALCEDHYYSESTGRVVQKLREVSIANA